MWTPSCGFAYVTSRSIDLSPHSDAVASLSLPASITMFIRKSLSAWNGAPLSTWWRMDMLLRVRESACTRGWCWFTCARDRWHNRACRVLTSASPQHGHVAARNSSIPGNLFPAVTNSDARMVLAESTGLALRKAVASDPDWLRCRALAKSRVYYTPIFLRILVHYTWIDCEGENWKPKCPSLYG